MGNAKVVNSGPVQRTLFEDTAHRRRFEQFLQTEHGRQVANLFIRLAYGAKKRGVKVGAKAVVERIRWHFMLRDRDRQAHFKINNNYTAYLARFAIEREPFLDGYFELRTVREPGERGGLRGIGYMCIADAGHVPGTLVDMRREHKKEGMVRDE